MLIRERSLTCFQKLRTIRCPCRRSSIDGQLWGLALFIGHACGESAFKEAAAAMAKIHLQKGSPMHTLVSTVAVGAADSDPGISSWQFFLSELQWMLCLWTKLIYRLLA